MPIQIRTYQQTDKERVLLIFESNCPKYFEKRDEADLLYFLENFADKNFMVVIKDQTILGCGGHYVKHEKKQIGIAWVMFQRYSLGASEFSIVSREFFNTLLDRIGKEKLEYDILINTTQLLERTFNKLGFQTQRVIPSGFGKNLDHLVMRRKWNFE